MVPPLVLTIESTLLPVYQALTLPHPPNPQVLLLQARPAPITTVWPCPTTRTSHPPFGGGSNLPPSFSLLRV